MAGEPVALRVPAVRAAEGEHPGVLAGAVVEDAVGGAALLRAELELVFGGRGLGEECSDGGDLIVGRPVGRGGDREIAVVEVAACPCERERLDRLRRGAKEAGERGVAGLGDNRSVAHGDRVHPMHRLDDPGAAHLDDDCVHRRSLRAPERRAGMRAPLDE